MKIVINGCYGGFSLSPKGTERYALLSGRECYFYTNPRDPFELHRMIPITLEQAEKEFMWFAYDIPDVHERNWSPENWGELAYEERMRLNDEAGKHSVDRGRELVRHDPNLIRTIEELGAEADGKHAELKIVEIPDGVEYEIDEYDGIESIHEKHRAWS